MALRPQMHIQPVGSVEPGTFAADLIRRLHTSIRFHGDLNPRTDGALCGTIACLSGAIAAGAISLPMLAAGQDAASSLFAGFVLGIAGLIGGALVGHIVSPILGARSLARQALDFMPRASAHGSPLERAIVAELARTWLSRLDQRRVKSFEARDVLRTLAGETNEGEPGEGSPSADRAATLVRALDALYVAAAESRSVDTDQSQAIIQGLKNLTSSEVRAAGVVFWPWLFKANGATRVEFASFADANTIETMLRPRAE